MHTIAVGLAASALLAGTAGAQSVIVLPRPAFPPPVQELQPTGPRLELVSSRYHDPADLAPTPPGPPRWAPRAYRDHDLQVAVRQPGRRIFLVYGEPGHGLRPGRLLLAADERSRRLRYALDFVNFEWRRRSGWFPHVQWAREVERVLYVENTHLTYASQTRGRNAYITAIDIESGRILWRSRALVANARTFVVADDLIVCGYGFTAELDYLYLLDRKTGKVLDLLSVPSAPEVVKLRGDRLLVRTYDRDVVARIVR